MFQNTNQLYIEICLNWFGGRKLDTSLPRQMNIARTAGETLSNIAGGKRWNPKSRPPGVENSRSCWNKKTSRTPRRILVLSLFILLYERRILEPYYFVRNCYPMVSITNLTEFRNSTSSIQSVMPFVVGKSVLSEPTGRNMQLAASRNIQTSKTPQKPRKKTWNGAKKQQW